jgi:3-hydroxybutyryl-CoA dehydrogenase
VHAKSTPGFIVNRVARPFYGEALRLLLEQAGDCATIDAVMREAGGFRMGPFELMDLIGHDVNFSVTQSVFHAYFCDPRFTPSVLQQEMVNAGFLGRKSGRGFYRYGPDAVAPQSHVEAPQPRPEFVDCSTLSGPALLLAERLRASGVNFGLHRAEIDEEDTAAFYCNGAALHLTDGRSATERARANNHPDTVLFDLALDYRAAKRIAVSRADQCSLQAYNSVVGLLQGAGFVVSRLDDVPALAVMRTVAMLANEAFDAVHHGVCTEAGVDLALQKGVNYPRGPLAWADAVGLAHIDAVLSNLAAGYGEDRYRVSPLLRRKLARGGALHA